MCGATSGEDARLNKAKTENLELGRVVRRELGRHALDCAEVTITAHHGVIYLHGRVRPMRGHETVFELSVSNFLKVVRQRPGVREVIAEWVAIY
jgi:hypothetical protein